ncbi:MAG: site-specific DNA-methyltransferase, partial [Candidatus Korobacteraceae bacterium]
MANNKKNAKAAAGDSSLDKVTDYRFPEATRKNNPPAKIAAEGHVPLIPKAEYLYSPRRPPELRFDPTGGADQLPELLAKATNQKLTQAEAWVLAESLRAHELWLEWAGKRETKSFAVDPVALHIHERVSAQAILKVAAREDVNRSLFADPEQEYNEAVQFYKHDVDWSNRLILGDSLQVMSSLARREDLAGKVQMIYMDPPYGIKFSSNFQPEIGKREVKDKEADLTREPEMVKAYRDTWNLGTHSYLSYLRDRLTAARDMLCDSGSIFVQIGDENVHRVRMLLDELFGTANYICEICVTKTSSLGTELMSGVVDYILWYAKDISRLKHHSLYRAKSFGLEGAEEYTAIELPTGERRTLELAEKRGEKALPDGGRVYRLDNLTSQSRSSTTLFEYSWEGKTLGPGAGGWKTNLVGMNRLAGAQRIRTRQIGNTICYVRYINDFPAIPINSLWSDVSSGFNVYQPKVYVVQTNERILERCVLLATDPGDLVLDPTCGSGTTAEICEQWGRRWITIDTSRVAIAIARQRILTAKYDFFKLKNESAGVVGGFRYKTISHVTLKSIAQNSNLDPIIAKHEPTLEERLAAANKSLQTVPDRLRNELRTKLALKQKQEGKKSITEADRRRWDL